MATQVQLVKSDGTELSPIIGEDAAAHVYINDGNQLCLENDVDGISIKETSGGISIDGNSYVDILGGDVSINNPEADSTATGNTNIGNTTGTLSLLGSTVGITGATNITGDLLVKYSNYAIMSNGTSGIKVSDELVTIQNTSTTGKV